MKSTKLFNTISFSSVKRIMAVLLALVLLTSTACSSVETKDNSSNESGTYSQSDSSNVSSNIVSSEESSSKTDISSNTSSKQDLYDNSSVSKKPVVGDLSVEDEVLTSFSPADEDALELLVDPSNLMYNYKGYADEERNERLDDILNTPNTEELYEITGQTYYVSAKGNDENDGKTPETAIQTLAAVDGLLLKEGDAVLFERGSVWRMTELFTCRGNIIYGSYGEGRKPMFIGSAKNFAKEKWTPSNKKNVWKISYMYAYPCGAFFNQGEEAGYLKTSMRAMTANTHFFYDESLSTLYLYCDKGDPSKVWDSIEFSQAKILFEINTGVNDVVIDNIAIRYTGQGGVRGGYNNHNITVTNCEIGYTGGAWVGGNPSSGVRYCNAIEMWCSGSGHNFSHNWIYQTFDSALTPQGSQGFNYHNITMDNNLLEFNNADFECFEEAPGTYKNYTMDNNICRFTSLGWGTRADDGGIRGIDGVQRGTFKHADQIISMSFSNNIIDCPGRHIYKMTVPSMKSYKNWRRNNNVYYLRQSLRTDNRLTINFHWKDEQTRIAAHNASSEAAVLAAFAEFEPSAKVYWYK